MKIGSSLIQYILTTVSPPPIPPILPHFLSPSDPLHPPLSLLNRVGLQETEVEQEKTRYNMTRQKPPFKAQQVNPTGGQEFQKHSKVSEIHLLPLWRIPQHTKLSCTDDLATVKG